MRALCAALVIAFALAPPVLGGEKELFEKFKRQNDQGRDKLKVDIKVVLDKAQAVEKEEPAKALLLLEVTRDHLVAKGLLAAKNDRELFETMLDRIVALRAVVRGKQANELRVAVAEFKEYRSRMNEQFAELRHDMLPPNKEVPPGGPGYIAMANGTILAGWINAPPVFVVQANIKDQQRTLAAGTVAGVHAPEGYYVFMPGAQRFVLLPNAEFFLSAATLYPQSRKRGFWLPAHTPALPPGFFERSAGANGAALFDRSAAALMLTWSGPGGTHAEKTLSGKTRDPATALLYRDVVVDMMVQELFTKLKKTDQDRFRDVILTFLDRRASDYALTQPEVVQLSDLIAEISAERRSEAVSFCIMLNRLFDQRNRLRKR